MPEINSETLFEAWLGKEVSVKMVDGKFFGGVLRNAGPRFLVLEQSGELVLVSLAATLAIRLTGLKPEQYGGMSEAERKRR
jgi:hypothetical protein